MFVAAWALPAQRMTPSNFQSTQELQTYTPEAIREDFATLYRNLQDSAYDLFIFTDKTEFDAEYERLLSTLTEPMTAHEVSKLFQSFVVKAKISHCTIQFPIGAFREWYGAGGRFFPFDLVFDGDRPLISVDWSRTDGIDIERYRALSDSLTEPEFMMDGREFRFFGDVAYLRPGPFMSLSSSDLSEHETWDPTEFLSFMDSVFTVIAAERPENLILDIRGNPGGGSSFSNPMIAYLADRPFREASELRFRTSRITKEFWRDYDDPAAADLKHEILSREDGERWSVVQEPYPPRSDSLRYEGRTFALIDRFSYSNAAAVASILQDYGFATLIGEETSFNPSNCGGVHTFRLPHTGMEVVYPKVCGVRPSGDVGPHGVIPEHEVRQDYFTEEDEVLQGALRIIKESRGDMPNPR
jgi:C-terminal processing protease CtpA/Prc